jgi:hypothetical protein
MRRLFRSRPAPGTLLAILALVVATAGVVRAAIPDEAGVIHACYDKAAGPKPLYVIDSTESCGQAQAALNWSQRGPTGASGPPGAGELSSLVEVPHTQATIPNPGDSAVVAQVRGIDPGAWLLVFAAGAGPTDPSQSGVREEVLDCKVEASSSGRGRQTIRAFEFYYRHDPSADFVQTYRGASAGPTDFGLGSAVRFIDAFALVDRGRIVVTCKRGVAGRDNRAFDGPWYYHQHQLLLMSFDHFRNSR